MGEQYFYIHDAAEHGPYTAIQMRDRADSGQILPGDLIWKEGTTRRFPASSIANLLTPGGGPAPGPAAPHVEIVAAPEIPAEAPPSLVDAESTKPVAAAPATPARPRRVTSIRGGILCGQDGHTVRFKKKCDKCGHEEPTRTAAIIRTGAMRIPFYCPKCRKSRVVEMQGIG